MRLSTKGRYSTRLMIDIAVYGNDGFVFLKDVARRERISEKYLGHLVALLKNAGLIHTIRGPHGGVTLAKEASEITLKDIILAVEGPILLDDEEEFLEHQGVCGDLILWKNIRERVSGSLDSYSLESMALEQKRKMEELNYAI